MVEEQGEGCGSVDEVDGGGVAQVIEERDGVRRRVRRDDGEGQVGRQVGEQHSVGEGVVSLVAREHGHDEARTRAGTSGVGRDVEDVRGADGGAREAPGAVRHGLGVVRAQLVDEAVRGGRLKDHNTEFGEMRNFQLISLACMCLCVVGSAVEDLTIAAFNGKVFGVSKMADPFQAAVFRDLVLSRTIFVLQEIKDATGAAIQDLLTDVRAVDSRYQMALSPRTPQDNCSVNLGAREQYAVFYRDDAVEFLGQRLVVDSSPCEGEFVREPFAVHLRTKTGSFEFVLLTAHLSPNSSSVNRETVYEARVLTSLALPQVTAEFGVSNAVVLGDLNAGCDYIKPDEFASIPLFNSPYAVLINDSADTTAGGTACAYDRIIVTSGAMESRSSNAFVWHYLNLNQTIMESVSDHYPVSFTLTVDSISTVAPDSSSILDWFIVG